MTIKLRSTYYICFTLYTLYIARSDVNQILCKLHMIERDKNVFHILMLYSNHWFKQNDPTPSTNIPWQCLQDAKRMRRVLHGGFVEIISAVKGDRGYFFPSFPYLYAATILSLSNGIQNSDKWLLLQYIGTSLWLCICPWHLLLGTSVHYNLAYNGRVLEHLGLSFSPLGLLTKHLYRFYAAEILQLGRAHWQTHPHVYHRFQQCNVCSSLSQLLFIHRDITFS